MDIDTILSLIDNSPATILSGISSRVKARRLELGYTQQELAGRAGIPLPTYRRFERSGEIALRSLIMLGIALDATGAFADLFAAKSYSSIDELLDPASKKSKRGKRRS
jgi:transcriptional regulator with XRE-family HTH domain